VGRIEYNVVISVGSSLFFCLLPAWIFVKTMFPKVLHKLRKKERAVGETTWRVRRECMRDR